MNQAATEEEASFLPELETDDLSFFIQDGFRKLMRAMLKQSIKDILVDRKDARAPAEVSASARWLGTAGGHDCIQFLMPGVTSGKVIAKIYEDPQLALDSMNVVDLEDTKNVSSVDPVSKVAPDVLQRLDYVEAASLLDTSGDISGTSEAGTDTYTSDASEASDDSGHPDFLEHESPQWG